MFVHQVFVDPNQIKFKLGLLLSFKETAHFKIQKEKKKMWKHDQKYDLINMYLQ